MPSQQQKQARTAKELGLFILFKIYIFFLLFSLDRGSQIKDEMSALSAKCG